ncbi:S8 family serine peptidase [Aquimarina sp. ERC-38]|uniref:S8 family serine peptidase n=1 Tax=Aquimarina sp. ERC-38 TaxID=2949996 RepID=UPI002246064F|nr:S8 family serine peptidase [Aquimarina sp. ERC-38]UZO82064.1 S8 family serine peptidase [Aquimarina sp. ERC-38]
MKKELITGIISLIVCFGCTTPKALLLDTTAVTNIQKTTFADIENWHLKDIINDTIPGISMVRACEFLKDKKIKDSVIVAVLDMEVAIDHKDLKNQIWINKGEIANNGLDDDGNGYVDDVHGWNFLGNSNGDNNIYVNYEYTRIIKKFNEQFQGKKIEQIKVKKQQEFLTYRRALKKHKERYQYGIKEKENADFLYHSYYEALDKLSSYFPKKDFNLKSLDSLDQIIPDKEEKLKFNIITLQDCLKYNITEDYIKNEKHVADERMTKLLDTSYNDRLIQQDDPFNLLDTDYGNHIVNGNINILDHGTLVSGVISASIPNEIVAEEFSSNIKIMPLCISAYGDEHDKDIVLAIRYAVDNGAKVINMSFSKEFSLLEKEVLNAIKYAADHGVLIVKSAGNNSKDLDKLNNYNFPNDAKKGGNEIANNFIKVGASTNKVDKNLKNHSSNFGKKEVDVFAPSGFKSTSTGPDLHEEFTGTSSSTPLVSSIAALLYSYYPHLSVSQVKEIILNSGTLYHIDVEITQDDGTKKMVPFSSLSKSGKIVNAYNALIMADKIASQKK